MKKITTYIISLLLTTIIFTSCFKDLDTIPLDEDEVVSARLFENAKAYKQFLAKIYAGLTLTGQAGPAGAADIDVADEGFSSYLRQLWIHQEIPTDEAVTGWGDPGLPEYNYQAWTPSNDFTKMMYYRVFYQITLCNEFIRESSDSKLDSRGFDTNAKNEIKAYRAEARFLRALSYWHVLDLFGDAGPFVTEKDPIGSFLPQSTSKNELFSYIINELNEVKELLPEPGMAEYGRVDKAAALMLAAKVYLNAKIYVGEDHYSECLDLCEAIIAMPYTLAPNYQDNFLADNNTSPEIIFGLPSNGINSKTYGGTTFIVHSAVGGKKMNAICEAEYGIDGGWAGHRATPEFVSLFPSLSSKKDSARAMFYTDGQSLEINNLSLFTNGYAIDKFKNVDKNGNPGSDLTFVDIDFPMFRLADVYLMYAEAHLRGGGGDAGKALEYVNKIRERAYGNSSGNIATDELTLDFILDERGRELYWEAQRRTDLRRFKKYTGVEKLWAWKGGEKAGASTDVKYELYPIPASELNANPNLTQNPGY